jgi:hypothetical protein
MYTNLTTHDKSFGSTKSVLQKSRWFLTFLLSTFGMLQAQATVINITPAVAPLKTGSVNSAGTKNDGNMVNINTNANRGWATFSLSGIPSGAIINSANIIFTTFSSINSGAANSVYTFTGDPATLSGTALYSAIVGTLAAPNAAWPTATPTQTRVANPAALTMISSAYTGNTDINVGYVRTSTNNYNIYGYSGVTPPVLQVDYTILTPCSGTPISGSASPLTATRCFGQSQLFTASGLSGDAGITYQWQSSTTPGGPYNNIAGATNTTFNPGVLPAGVYYYVLTSTCANSGLSASSPEVSLVVNDNPNVSVATTSTNVCLGTSATLTASSTDATTPNFSWTPGAATTNTISASPTALTNYIVTATNAAGCTATAAQSISVSSAPVLGAISATPTSICVGPGNASSLSIVVPPVPQLAQNYSFSTSVGTFTSLATEPSATQVPIIEDDDATSGLLPIGFNFTFDGTTYTDLYANSNGFLALGSAPAGNTYSALNTVPYKVIAPFWNDGNGGLVGEARYATTGVAPNRIFTMEWLNWQENWQATGATLSFQVKLFETSNVIQFVYQQEATPFANTIAAGIGISGGNTNYVSVNGTTTAATSSTTVVTANATKPTTGLTYTFAPPATGMLTYDWQPIAELDLAGSNNTPTVSAILDGVANIGVSAGVTFTVSVTNAAGCSATATTAVFGVVTGGAPVVTATATTNTICAGTATTINADITNGGAPFIWKVEDAAGILNTVTNNSTTYSLSVTPAVTTTYTVSCEDFCNGASVTALVTITVNPAPMLTVTPTTALYCGTTPINIVAGGAVNYSWAPASGLNATNTSTVDASPAATTVYTLTGTDAIGCTATATAAITSSLITAVVGTASPADVCVGGSSQLTIADVKELAAGPQTAPTTYCTASASVFLSGDEDITNVTFGTLNNTTACNNTSVNAIGSYGPAVSSNGDFYSDFTNAPAPTVTAGSSVNYSITTSLCSGFDYSNVIKIFIDYNRDGDFDDAGEEAAAGVNPSIFGSPTLTDINTGTITISATAAAGLTRMRVRSFETTDPATNTPCGEGGYGEVEDYLINIIGQTSVSPTSISWSPATYLDVTTGYAANATNVTTSQTYTITATNAVGCTTTGTIAINAGSVFTMQPVTASASTVCAGTTVTLTANAAGGGQPYTYAWDNLATTNTIAVTPATTTTYTVEVTDACSAIGTETFTINVNPLPALAINTIPTNALICGTGNVAIDIAGADSYSWTPATGLSSTTGASITSSVAISTTYTVTGTNTLTGCTSSAAQAVNFGFVPTLGVSALNSAICSGASTILSAADTINSGASAILITEAIFFNGGTNTGVIPAYAAGGQDLIEISNISNSPVDISGYNFSDYNGSGTTAPSHTLTFPAGTIIPGNSTLLLHMGSGTDDIANRYYNTGGGIDNYFSSSTGYAFVLKKANGSVADVVANNFTFDPLLAVPATEWSGNAPNAGGLGGILRNVMTDNNNATDFANSSAVTLSVGVYNNASAPTGTYQGGYASPLTYNGNSVTWANAANLSSATGYTIVTNNLTATETFTVTTTSAAGCTATSSITITVGDPLVCNALTSSLGATICEGQSTTITGSTTGGGAPYTYTFVSMSNNTTIQTGTTASLSVSPIATETYVVSVTDGCNGSCSQSYVVTVNPKPNVSITSMPASALVCNGSSVSLDGTSTTSGVTYTWGPAAGLSAVNTAIVSATPAVTTTYSLVVTDAIGCTNIASTSITSEGFSLTLAGTGPLCPGGVTTLTATPAPVIVNTPAPSTYCAADGGCDEAINAFNFANISTNTACNGYENFTTTIANVVKGQTYPVGSSSNNYYGTLDAVHVWIDYNQNGIFESSELLSLPLTNPTSSTITIPMTALSGNTRLRVRMAYNQTSADPCGSQTFGEVEDYTVNISNPAPTGLTYAYSNGITGSGATESDLPTATTVYTVTASTALGCSVTATTEVVVNTTPIVTATATATNVAIGATTSLTATGAASYVWTPAAEISGAANTAVVTAAPTGAVGTTQTYFVIGTDANGCSGVSSTTINIVSALAFDPAGLNGAGTFGGTINCFGGSTDINYSLTNATPPLSVTINGTTVGTSPVAGYTAGIYTLVATDGNASTTSTIITITEPTQLVITPTISNHVLCNGGLSANAYVVVTGGTPDIMPNAPYIYLWTGSVTGVDDSLKNAGAGLYDVTVVDANACIASVSLTITEPSVIGTTISLTNVSCAGLNDGSASVTVTGGVSPYTYSWNNAMMSTTDMVTGLGAGSYTVTITDANGCSVTTDATITEPGNLGGVINSTNILCNGTATGTAQFDVTGGTANYTYAWSPSGSTAMISGLIAGTYSVIATDANGCTTTGSIVLNDPLLLTISSATSTPISCNGGTSDVTIVTTGGTGSVTTSPSTTGLVAGPYVFTVTDANGCSATTSVLITEPTALTATATSTNPLCNGLLTGTASTSVNGGTAPYTYNWSNMTTLPSLTGVGAGSYTCNITDANNCSTAVVVSVTEPTAVSISSATATAISCAGGTSDVTIVAAGGTGSLTTSPSTMGLTANSYTFTVTDANSCSATTVVAITEPTAVVLTASSIDASCLGTGGSISATATGGTMPVTVTVNGMPLASSYPVGLYTVMAIDANMCSAMTVVSVNAAVTMSITATSSAPLCNGTLGAITYNTTGGAAPLTTTINGMSSMSSPFAAASGAYTVVTTDAQGCTISATTMVPAAPSAIVITNVNKSDITCGGLTNGVLQAIAVGGTAPLAYSINPTGTATTPGNYSGLASGNYTVTVTDANGCTITSTATIGAPATLAYVPNVIYAPSYCTNNDGIISVWANGGTGSKTYTIMPAASSSTSGSFNALAAGTYTVNATDANGCSLTTEVVLANTPVINLTGVAVVGPKCINQSNGTAIVTATGGTPSLTYAIAPAATQTAAGSFSGLAGGSYTITVKDGRNCSTTSTIMIANPTALSIGTPVAVSPSCNGGANGSLVANAMGGLMPYTYVLTPTTGMMTVPGNFINLTSKIYVVKVTDANGCTSSKALPLVQPAKVVFTGVTKTNVSCNGGADGAITATTVGGSGMKTLSAMPSGSVAGNVVSGLAAGAYTLTATDTKSCTGTTAVTVNQPVAIVIGALVTVNPTSAANGTIVISATGGTGSKTYGIMTGGTQTAPGTFSGLAAGSYTLNVTDAKGCTASTTATLTQATAIVNNGSVVITDVTPSTTSNFNVYPNPTNGPTTIAVNVAKESTLNINVLDANGRKVKTIVSNVQAGENNVRIDLTDLNNGVYVLQMQVVNGEASNKLIKKQ